MAAQHHRRNLDAGPLQPMIDSFELNLASVGKAKKTRITYREAAQWFAGELLVAGCEDPPLEPVTDWEDVTRNHIRAWTARLFDRGYSDSYVSNQYRALQAFFKWFAGDEDVPNIMLGMEPPQVADKPVPIFTEEEMQALFATTDGRDFVDRRDRAILMFLRDTGLRLSECAGLNLDDLNVLAREATVTGKAKKVRTVKYSYAAAQALDRYVRARKKRLIESKRVREDTQALWIGPRGRLTANGIYRIVKRRGQQAKLDIHPHRFRHHFSHTWLDRGGAEGDLMELNGWDSPQMLRRYGRSAAAARARRSYDRIMDGAD